MFINIKNIILSPVVSIIFYYILVKKYNYTASFELVLNDVDPRTAWEYFSEFENIKQMNPTIFAYEILTGTGNFKSLKYSVQYNETLSLSDYFIVELTGDYELLPATNGQPYRIFSAHDSCQFGFCLYGTDKMYLMDGDKKKTTKIIQNFVYECQLLLSPLCEAAFLEQRKLIYENMKAVKNFSGKTKK